MDIVLLIFMLAIGACIGSFLNVVIWRLPRGQSIVFPGSHCPVCGRAIRWYDNIPLLSYLLLRARCRACKASISIRYPLIELATAVLVGGLYVCYYMLNIRHQPTPVGFILDSWPMFLAHAALLCGLLVCTAVDIEMWIVPLEVTWVVALAGLGASTYSPHPWMPTIAPATGAAALAALVGLGVGQWLVHKNLIQASFIDASDKPIPEPAAPKKNPRAKAAVSVAITTAHGVNQRREVLREVLFLMPAFVLAFGAWLLVTQVSCVHQAWGSLFDNGKSPLIAPHLRGATAAIFGYLVGGGLIWGTRILGTLGFGKEAMGLGDVHILAAVGAVAGWIVPTIAFFLAPVLGLLWAIYLLASRGQRELPYGPWLAAASVLVMLGYDWLSGFVEQYTLLGLWR